MSPSYIETSVYQKFISDCGKNPNSLVVIKVKNLLWYMNDKIMYYFLNSLIIHNLSYPVHEQIPHHMNAF